MALKKVKGNFERMFDKNLTDLVRGIRNNKDNEASAAISNYVVIVSRHAHTYNLLTSCQIKFGVCLPARASGSNAMPQSLTQLAAIR